MFRFSTLFAVLFFFLLSPVAFGLLIVGAAAFAWNVTTHKND